MFRAAATAEPFQNAEISEKFEGNVAENNRIRTSDQLTKGQ